MVFPRVRRRFGHATVYLPAPDLDNLAHPERVRSSGGQGLVCRTRLAFSPAARKAIASRPEGKGEQGTRIECPMVIGIAWQDKAMSQGFEVLGLRLRHARRVPAERELIGTGCDRNQENVSRDSSDRNYWKSTDPHSLVSPWFFGKQHKDFTRRIKNPHQAGV